MLPKRGTDFEGEIQLHVEYELEQVDDRNTNSIPARAEMVSIYPVHTTFSEYWKSKWNSHSFKLVEGYEAYYADVWYLVENFYVGRDYRLSIVLKNYASSDLLRLQTAGVAPSEGWDC